MKLNWTAVGTITAILLPLMVWGARVETRIDRALDVDERLTNIEELMRPLIVEHEVQKRLTTHIRVPKPPEVIEEVASQVDERIKQYRPIEKR